MIRERCLIIKSAGFMQRCWHLLSSFQYENSNYKSTNFPLHVQSFTVQVFLKLLLLIPQVMGYTRIFQVKNKFNSIDSICDTVDYYKNNLHLSIIFFRVLNKKAGILGYSEALMKVNGAISTIQQKDVNNINGSIFIEEKIMKFYCVKSCLK